MSDVSIAKLKSMTLAELEKLYVQQNDIRIPQHSSYRGTTLQRLKTEAAQEPITRVSQWLLFEALPYGINFHHNSGDWFFFMPALNAGSFTAKIEKSRWRDTMTITMKYQVSQLSGLISNLLYDEVKPIGNDLLLGIGGTNADKGKGDHFFFVLEPITQ